MFPLYSDEQLSSPTDFHFPYELQYPQSDASDSPPSSPQLSVLTSEFPAILLQSAYSSPTDSCDPSPVDSPLSPFSPYPPAPFVERPGFPSSLLPDPTYGFPPEEGKPNTEPPLSSAPARTIASRTVDIAHPYARLYTKHEGSKRRKMWNHALEKALFTPQEISTMGAPHRRTIYTASLEAHIDRLHAQLLGYDLFPVPFERLEPLHGLNSKTAKVICALSVQPALYTHKHIFAFAEYGRRP
ncbi:hypothetical protein BKA93DRAFT_180064 [Sparassis latifolia]